MCISISQVSRFRIHLLASSCYEHVHGWRNNSIPKLLNVRAFAVDGKKRWIRRNVSTTTEGRNNTKNNTGVLTGSVSVPISGIVGTDKTENWTQLQLYPNLQKRLSEDKDLSKHLTVIVCDLETTGLNKEKGRIIEIAAQDLAGGENSTFQTLINPGEIPVMNSDIHGIRDDMVRRPEVPRMEELIPIFLKYIRSRQKPEGYVMLVAHNGKSFDFRFLINEFKRCSYEIPQNWLLLDSLPLARENMKPLGSKSTLEVLGQYYNISRSGQAHRALSDVLLLSQVFQRLTFDLKLSLSDLVLRSLTVSDLTNPTPKKKKA